MNSSDAFMIDLDGTIYKGSRPIDGALEFIVRLKERNIPFVFLTNNSSSSRKHYLMKLNSMGFDVSMENVLTSTTATIRYIIENHRNASVFPMGTPDMVAEIEDAGITVDEDDADIVLLGFDRTMTYERINKAYHMLLHGKVFIATHPDDLCPTENGYDVDIGPFIRLLESMTSVKATVIGKPNSLMIDMAAMEMNASKERMIMVGDRLYTDMRMAADSGIRSYLVLSGETKADDLKDSDIIPTKVFDSVRNIADEL